MKLNVNPDDLTVGDLVDFEAAAGQSFFEAFAQVETNGNGTPTAVNFTAKALQALVWVVQRKANPAFTLDDARAVKVTGLQFDADPTTAA